MIKKITINLIALGLIITSFNGQNLAKDNISQLKSNKTTLYLGSFMQLPAVNFCVLYDGEIIEIQDGVFTIKDRLITTVNLLFVDLEKIKFCLEDCTVQEIKLKTTDYQFFELALTQFPAPSDLKDSYSSSWKITRKKIDNQIIPLNTVIIPISPSKVDIAIDNILCKPSNLAFKLPVIKLSAKKNKILKNLMLEGYLQAIALKPFYSKQRIKSINQNAIKVSLIV